MPIKIALVGYGRMGKEIEGVAGSDVIISARYDIDNPLPEQIAEEFDVAIDFSNPGSVAGNVRTLARNHRNIVIGTTGWYSRMQEMESIVKSAGICCVWGSNFSIGVNLFFRIVEQAARLLDKVDGYDVAVHEMHHRHKKDSPSGTAITIADIILQNYSRKTETCSEAVQGEIPPGTLHVSSQRVGEVPGTHTVIMDSAADTIELTHRARGRKGLALGALSAAKWTIGREGFYSFNEVMGELLD